jgi:hypothetical protein
MHSKGVDETRMKSERIKIGHNIVKDMCGEQETASVYSSRIYIGAVQDTDSQLLHG